MNPKNNRDLNQGVLHFWSKFGDCSLSGWQVIVRTNWWLTDTHTHIHTHTHRQTQATTIPEGHNWPRVKMNWDEHINNVKSKLIKYFAIFNYMKTYVSKQLATQLYYEFIFPHIKYGIETYGASSSSKVKQIQVIQNKLMKIILWKDLLTPTNTLHKDINILQVKDLYSWYIALFVRDCLYKDKIEIFHKYYDSRNSVHSHATRNRKQFIEPRYRTDIGFTTVKSKGSKIWNKLPEEIKKLNIRTTYKDKLRSKYIESYD